MEYIGGTKDSGALLDDTLSPMMNRHMKVNALRELQSQTQEELDALLPSVLDRAFKGMLG